MKKPNIKALNTQSSADYWKNKYNKLKEKFEQYKTESIKWSIEDFTDMKLDGWSITKDQAQEALNDMINSHDASSGIDWNTVEYYLQKYGTEVEEGKELWRKNYEKS